MDADGAMMSAQAPVRVLDLRDTYEIGGPGKTILETFRYIDRQLFELHLAVFVADGESGDTPFTREAHRYGMPVHHIRGAGRYDPRMIRHTARLCRDLGIHIVHAHEVKSDVIAILAGILHSVPSVTTMHGWIGNSRRQRGLVALDKLVARRFDRVIAVSSRIRQQLMASGVPAAKVRLVHNAIVLERYQRTGRRGLVAALTGREIAGPVLVSIGRLSQEKGHSDLLLAVDRLARDGHRVSVVLAGEGQERPRLAHMIHERGLGEQAFLVGHVESPGALLEEADLMVLPSHTEGLPNAALEALAMGVPVLATDVGGTPEVITDRHNGRLVAAHAPDALANAIVEFLDDRDGWRGMAERGRADVIARFDFRTRTRSIEALYREMVGLA